MRQDINETRWEQDEMRKNRRQQQDKIQQNAFYSDETLTKQEYIWITSESDLNKIFESDLNKIWVRSEQERDEMQFNVMMHRWDWNRFESHLSQIWTRWDEMHFNMMMHEQD